MKSENGRVKSESGPGGQDGRGGRRGQGGGRAAATAGVNLSALRSHNAALVLDLLRGAGGDGISRLELAERTGLTPQAVSKITARLRAEGLAREAGHRASTGGKPRTVLCLVPSAAYAIGVHLDRDEVTTVLLDLAGTRVATRRVPLDLGAGAEAVLDAVEREVSALRAPAAAVVKAGAEVGAAGAAGAATEAGATAQDGAPGVRAARDRSAVPGAYDDPAVPGAYDDPAVPGAYDDPAVPGAYDDPAVPSVSNRPAVEPVALAVPAVIGVGVAMPGPLDHPAGEPGRVTGFPEWDGYPLRDELARRLRLPVELDKDTNAAALGLALRSPAADSFAYVHLGTGVGAGLVLDGRLLRGARTGAGEFGHQTVQLDGPPCDCGGRGCLEVLCLAAVARGDLAEAARILGTGAANLVRLLDIDRVLLGGRTVLAAPGVFADGAHEVLAGLGLPVPVAVAGTPHTVAEGAAQLILSALFGK
ncbi:ROK family protein [Streptomyces sp. NPDC093600]|uniref:ROK family protein n=1 Tax=Streptomyces sp. NPDC093600 TaxID=3366047 RepID=UPI00381190D0